jgi:putative membrane protein
LLLVVFLLGLLPTMAYYQAIRWRLRQRLTTAQNAVETLRATAAVPAPQLAADPEPLPVAQTIPPASVPTAVPPGGA